MKAFIIVLLVLALALIVLQSFVIRSSEKTEMQKYTVLEKDGKFEIRHYPIAIAATIEMNDSSYRETAYKGFRVLAKYIFGGNEKQQSIPMTAPVHMQWGDSATSMSFIMPSSFKWEDLPSPNDSSVRIRYCEEEYVASVTFGGFYSDKEIKANILKLQHYLESKGLIAMGEYRYLGYNPSYQLFNRRNEIIVRIRYDLPA